MESKWPFMLIAFGLVFLLGLVLSGLERTNVMKHWDKRRCDFAVMAAAGFFKEDADPRSRTEFAKDNFQFCMGTFVDKFLTTLMVPVSAMFEKQVNITENSMGVMTSIRMIAQTLYNTLSSYLDQFYRRFNSSIFEISRIMQYLRMAMDRINAMAVSMIYSGIIMFRGMINSIQFVIKVILIICGIMIAAIIVLWFVLFPVIPIIISTLGAIVLTVAAMASIISSQVSADAKRSRGPFCFDRNTLISIIDNHGKERQVPVTDIKLGDQLSSDAGSITAIIVMDGMDVPLYDVNGIRVSGSHLIKGTDGQWKCVSDDERAKPMDDTAKVLYCFNTSTHNIPVYSSIQHTTIMFRDWEEFAENDTLGHYFWNYVVLKYLNGVSSYSKWKDSMTIFTEVPLLGSRTKVKTKSGYVELSKIKMGEQQGIVDKNGRLQKVMGKVFGHVENASSKTGPTWHTELFECVNQVWIKGESTVTKGKEIIQGENIITETGELIIWDEKERRDKVIRDFTDIGYKSIHETYPLVASRLRIYE